MGKYRKIIYAGITPVEDGVIAVGQGGKVVKYDLDGNIAWENTEKLYNNYKGITKVEDGAIVVADNGKVVKYDLNGNIAWENTEKKHIYTGITTVEDGAIAVSSNGHVVKYKNHIAEPEIISSKNVVIKNKIAKYRITTKVDGYGGTISGKDQNPYEEVKYNEQSTKDIIAVPQDGYKVEYISINGRMIDFVQNNDMTVTLDKFVSMKEDKEVIVSFTKDLSSLTIKKQDSVNGNPLANVKFNIKQIETRNKLPIIDIKNVVSESTYNFIDNGNGGIESNNQGKASTTANSYIPIDLREYSGKYNLIVNANVSSQIKGDYGYVTLTTSTAVPATYITKDRIVYISGTSALVSTSKNYSIAIDGGKMYYLHFCYYKNGSEDSGEDKFTINSVNFTFNTDDFIEKNVITNLNGETTIGLDNGKYQITELETLKGYTLNSEPIIYDFVSGQENIITVTNRPQVDLIVHHYLKGTNIPILEDENIKGDFGKTYSTSPKVNLEKYQLVKKSDGSYDIPLNASGVFTDEVQVVTYYYETKPFEVIVHHYVDGTEDKVAEDEKIIGEEGKSYSTSPIEKTLLEEKYELVESKLPENASGVFKDYLEEVIYYYKVKEYNITTEVDGIGGTISGQGQKSYEKVLYNENSIKDIVITPNNGYEIESITINGVVQDKINVPKFENVTEDKHIIVKFKIKSGNITITNNWEDNNNLRGKRPDKVEIQLFEGSNLISSSIINTNDNIYVFENMPLYSENGKLIEYRLIEKEVNVNELLFYETNIVKNENESFIVTNEFKIPELMKNISVVKIWADNSNSNGKRPLKIKLQVKNGDTLVKENIIDVTEDNTQTYTFTGLIEYDENGDEIKYAIDEVEVNPDDLKFYSKSINNDNYTITNTFTVPEDKITIDVTKKWEDNSNENNTRPSQIKLQVKKEDKVEQEKVFDVTNENEKIYTFTDIAKYDSDGKEIVYTVDEIEVQENDLIGYTKNIEGNIITNIIKQHNITTEVNGIGGTISGQNDEPYEVVNHGGTSINDIKIIPSIGYEISKIKINDIEQTLPENRKEEYNLNKFSSITEDKHVIVEFKKIEYKITTEVEGIGGNITGQNDNPYEIVLHEENSIKDIVVTPNNGYKISRIKVNGTEIQFTPNDDKTYILDKFTNMLEDKHIVVSFENIETSIIVKHQTETGDNLIELEIVQGIVGQNYETSSEEFSEYELKVTPDNASGNMAEEQIEVIYVYSLVKGKLTITKVDKKDNTNYLSGATFKLEKLNADGEIDKTFNSIEKTTSEDGRVEFTELLVGKYRVSEVKAPEEYELSKEAADIEISKAQKEVNLTAANRLKLELPETGKVNYMIVIAVIGSMVMTVSIILNNIEKRKNL